MDRGTQINFWYFILALLGVVLLRDLWVENEYVDTVPYSVFEQYVADGIVKEVTISDTSVRGTLKEPRNGKTAFVTTRVEPDLAKELQGKGIIYSGAVQRTWLTTLLSWFLPVLLFFGLWMLLIRRMGGGGLGGMLNVGKSRAKIYAETDTKVSFDDVAGVDEAKAELVEVIEFMRNPQSYGRLGAHIPKGVLLVGPPGTGKTLLARAVAGEAGVPFFSISGSEFVELFVGVGAARVRDLFEQARKQAPAIIFIDELDALGRARGAMPMAGGNDEREQTLNQLLAELDGFDPSEGLVLLAATNRPEILDPALLRAGRFDRQILVDRPDRVGRVQILKVHMRKIAAGRDANPEEIAALTTGFSGADLANLVNEAALMATRRRSETVDMQDFTQAIERIVAGLEKRNRLLNPKEREIVAYHEMGHAIVSMSLPGTDEVHKVSIIPRGVGSLGYTIQRPTEDRFLMTREELENKIAVLMGGRAAEYLVFGHFSTGAADDLAKATDIARSMVARYGMDPDLGSVTYDSDRTTFLGQNGASTYFERRYSEATAAQLDRAVKQIIADVFERTVSILNSRRDELDHTAHALLEQETLDAETLRRLIAKSDAIEATPTA
ncbi:MAG: ATP-dependent zinc metalloprotease FtsH [Alphaproteobacteria bacterium]|nr:ATP-dependent zinc metalloprotease FtsH [Alphaproteobacteria bacterium]